jgi:hypothetical protein
MVCDRDAPLFIVAVQKRVWLFSSLNHLCPIRINFTSTVVTWPIYLPIVVVVLYLTYISGVVSLGVFTVPLLQLNIECPSLFSKSDKSFLVLNHKETAQLTSLTKPHLNFLTLWICIVTVLQVLYINRSSSWLSAYPNLLAVNPWRFCHSGNVCRITHG